MSLIGVACVRGHVPLAVHNECKLDPLHPCSLPPDVLDLMTSGPVERERNEVVYSPSTLMGCTRQSILTGKYDWYINVEGSAWKQTRGHMVHALMEEQPAWVGVLGVVREQRMSAPIETRYGEQQFKGKPDVVVLKSIEERTILTGTEEAGGKLYRTLHISITDYKSVGEVGHRDKADRKHQMQVNQYAWLAQQFLPYFLQDIPLPESVHMNPDVDLELFAVGFDEVVVDELEIFYADFNKTRRFTSAGVLSARGKRLPDHRTYEELELQPVYQMKPKSVERWVRKHIEMEIEAREKMPAPLSYLDRPFTGESFICYMCPVREKCVEIGQQQGYDTLGQGGTYVEQASEEASDLPEMQQASEVGGEGLPPTDE